MLLQSILTHTHICIMVRSNSFLLPRCHPPLGSFAYIKEERLIFHLRALLVQNRLHITSTSIYLHIDSQQPSNKVTLFNAHVITFSYWYKMRKITRVTWPYSRIIIPPHVYVWLSSVAEGANSSTVCSILSRSVAQIPGQTARLGPPPFGVGEMSTGFGWGLKSRYSKSLGTAMGWRLMCRAAMAPSHSETAYVVLPVVCEL